MLDSKILTFLVVCETMNYTKAAEKLYLTQPAISTQIKQLETEYDKKFFEYKDKKLSLTESGIMLKRMALTMRHDDSELRRLFEEEEKGNKKISFGATMTAGPYSASKHLSNYIKGNPDVNVEMTISSTRNLLQAIDDGNIDFALIEGSFPRADYGVYDYSNEPFCAVVSPSYKFKKKIKSIEDLIDERILIREEGSGTRTVFEHCIKNRNLEIEDFKTIIQINNIEMLKDLALEGHGITFLYEIAVRKEIEKGLLKKIEVEGFNATHAFSIVYRKGSMFWDDYKKIFEIK